MAFKLKININLFFLNKSIYMCVYNKYYISFIFKLNLQIYKKVLVNN